MSASTRRSADARGRAGKAAMKTAPGLETSLNITKKAVEVGLDAGSQVAGAVSGDGEPQSPLTAKLAASNSVDLLWFLERCEKESKMMSERYENFKDFAKKQDDPPGTPEIDLGATRMSWCIIFAMEESDSSEEGGGAGDVSPSGGPVMKVPRECVDLCQRLWACDVDVNSAVSTKGDEVFVTCGLTYEMLVDEAQFTKLHMRLKDAMGSVEFDMEKMHHYAPNQFEDLEDPRTGTVFTSAARQRMTLSRMNRLGGIDLEEANFYLPREESMKILKHHVDTNHHIRAKLVKEVLSAHGAFRPNVEESLGPEVAKLASQVIAEPFFTAEPTHEMTDAEKAVKHAQDESMRMQGLDPVQFEDISRVVEILNEWTAAEPGKSERYVGGMTAYYPLHCELELEYLREHWGTFSMMCPGWVYGKTAEASGTLCYVEQPDEGYKQFAPVWMPTDSVRDYFGDHVGVYFSWLQMYTKSLVAPTIFGLLTFLAPITVGNAPGTAPDENPLMAPYSIYLCIWSAMFLGMWQRRENELKFLWGSEHFEEEAPIRRQFVGVMTINEVTKKVHIEHKSQMRRAGKLTLAAGLSFVLICMVIVGAFTASMLRYHEAPRLCRDLDPSVPADLKILQNLNASITDGTLSCARCERPVYTDTQLHDYSLEPTYHTHNYTMTSHARTQYSRLFCEAQCIPGDVELGIPDTPGCVFNPGSRKDSTNASNVWNDGYPQDFTAWQKNKWKWSSAGANTILIVIFSNIYEYIAVSMNEWENHRTQTDYDDQLILKNFIFQFVNNYFVLFYIAYMRQIDLSGLPGVPDVDSECKGGSCLSELSIQVGVVFTTKTLIAQIMEIVMPRIKTAKQNIAQKLQIKKITKELSKTMNEAAQIVLPEEAEEYLGIDKASVARKEALDAKQEMLAARLASVDADGDVEGSAAEKESFLGAYESTFDDFNEVRFHPIFIRFNSIFIRFNS